MIQQSYSWAYIQEKSITQKDTCTPMFTAALFTIAKTLKEPKRPSADEWIKKTWYNTHTQWNTTQPWKEGRNAIWSKMATSNYLAMQLVIIILSEVSQKEKGKYPYDITYM